MSLRISSVTLDALDPPALAQFWCAVLGYEVVDEDEGVVSIEGPPGTAPLDLLPVSQGKSGKNRLHLDLRADGTTTAQELERLLALGARRVDIGQPPDASWVVLADPEGNEFCLLATAFQDL